MRKLIAALVFLSFGISHVAYSDNQDSCTTKTVGSLCVKTAANVKKAIDSIVAQGVKREEILVVFDIDNTLLTAKQDLGRDGWWEWQKSLLPPAEEAGHYVNAPVAKDIGGLIDIQYLLYNLGDMRLTDTEFPSLLSELQKQGHSVIALTARGPKAANVTLRELSEHGLYFNKTLRCTTALCRNGSMIAAGDIMKALSHVAHTPKSLARIQSSSVRPIFYANGVMMVSGQDKGTMLKLLLANSLPDRFEAIVFVDDGEKNIRYMSDAFPKLTNGPALTAIRFDRMFEDKEKFLNNKSRQQKAADDWEKIRSHLCELFPENDDRAYCKTLRIATWNVLRGTVEEIERRAQGPDLKNAKDALRADILILQELSSFAAAQRLAHHLGMTNAHIAVSDFNYDTGAWYKAHEVAIISKVPIVSVEEYDANIKNDHGNPILIRTNSNRIDMTSGVQHELKVPQQIKEGVPSDQMPDMSKVRGFLRVQLENNMVIYAVHLKSQRIGFCGRPKYDVQDAKSLLTRLQLSSNFESEATELDKILKKVEENEKSDIWQKTPSWPQAKRDATKREFVIAAIAERVADDLAKGYSVVVGGDFNIAANEPCKSGSNLEVDTVLNLTCGDRKIDKERCPNGDGYDDTHSILTSGIMREVRMRSLAGTMQRTHRSNHEESYANLPIDYLYVAGPSRENFTLARRIGTPDLKNRRRVFGSDHHPVLTTLRTWKMK